MALDGPRSLARCDAIERSDAYRGAERDTHRGGKRNALSVRLEQPNGHSRDADSLTHSECAPERRGKLASQPKPNSRPHRASFHSGRLRTPPQLLRLSR